MYLSTNNLLLCSTRFSLNNYHHHHLQYQLSIASSSSLIYNSHVVGEGTGKVKGTGYWDILGEVMSYAYAS